MNRSQLISIGLGLLVLVMLGSSLYTVSEVDQAIITRFGQPIGDPVTEPGLHMKVPFIDTANMFEKRFLEWDGFPNQVPTRDRRFIFVDTYARWRITDPLLFRCPVYDRGTAAMQLGRRRRCDSCRCGGQLAPTIEKAAQ